jgi:hypothetical protein
MVAVVESARLAEMAVLAEPALMSGFVDFE